MAWLVPRETAAISAQVLCTQYNLAACHFMQSHMRKVHACLDVTSHLHFWQNDRCLLSATAVTRGWNGYRNKSQHRKLTLEKEILPPLLPGPTRWRDLSITSKSGALTTELSPIPAIVRFLLSEADKINGKTHDASGELSFIKKENQT